jgi:hypothetical protein
MDLDRFRIGDLGQITPTPAAAATAASATAITPKTECDSESEDEDTERQTTPTPECYVWDKHFDYSTEERAEFKVIHCKWASREQAAVGAAAAGQPQDIHWMDRYADDPYNELLAVHERAVARVAVDSDGEDSGVQLTVSVATNILTSDDEDDKCKFLEDCRCPDGLPNQCR